MAKTTLTEVANQVQEFWSELFMDELKQDTLLPSLVNKDYEGEIKKGGDTVYVSQINRPDGQIKTIGVDADANSFSPEAMSTSRISIVANKRISASYEFDDVVDLQSQIHMNRPEIRAGLLEAIEIKLNDYLYSLTAPSTTAPDHLLDKDDMNSTTIAEVRRLAASSKWKKEGWYGLVTPAYYEDMLLEQKFTSKDYIEGESPVVGGQVAQRRFGFNVLEDNSDGLLTLAGAADATKAGLFFHKDYLHLAMQRTPTFKVSDLHANKEFGYVISVDMIVGAAIGIDGNIKHVQVQDAT